MNAKIAVPLDDGELAFLRTKLKIGEYDGEDILYAWMAVDELLGLRGKARKDPCCWSQDSEDSDIWASDCGKYFRLDDVDLVAAGFKFCPFCGSPITASRWVREEGREDDGPALLPVAREEPGPAEPTVGPHACQAGRDGECNHPDCPQTRDREPGTSGRHCPLPHWADDPEW